MGSRLHLWLSIYCETRGYIGAVSDVYGFRAGGVGAFLNGQRLAKVLLMKR